jgi:hypothetical protein
LNDKIVGEMVHVSGSFPSLLYKGFPKKYALLFLEQGSFIMHSLSYYRDIEDKSRKDKDEGEGRVEIIKPRPVLYIDRQSGDVLSSTLETGPVFFGTTSINPRYIFCFSGPKVDVKYLASQYGGSVVCINQPNKLVCDIASYLKQYPNMPDTIWLECIQVRYDKGQLVQGEPQPASEERLKMSYGQKDPKFSNDCEYRLVLTLPLTIIPPTEVKTEVKIELQKRLEYAELVHLQTDN